MQAAAWDILRLGMVREWWQRRVGPGVRYLIVTVILMAGFYALLYHPHEAESWPGQALYAYLRMTAEVSARILRWVGEDAVAHDTQVFGRFPYVVVLDCAALDAQALYAAAVLAFPARPWLRAVGVVYGLLAIFGINIARLVILYFAGAASPELFHTLHEEVLVFVVIALVCLLFLTWAWAARRAAPAIPMEIASHAS
jgi:exosortase/archaeosortase family protein